MKNFVNLLIVSILLSTTTALAQMDTMFFFKNGTVIDKIATNTFDSITYFQKNPYLNPNINYGSVMDIDGNTYATVSIGSQVWMAENLATTKYNDGTSVTYVSDNGTWTTTSSPAMCWLSNNIYYKNGYGGYYNWYAVDVSTTGGRNICPSGWHVPSDAEWSILEIYLQNNGYNYDGTIDTDNDQSTNNKIAKSMATATGWNNSIIDPGTIGNSDYPAYRNKSGFNALPGGYREGYVSGSFWDAGSIGFFWSSTKYVGVNVWSRILMSIIAHSSRNNINIKREGLSVRCIKDN